MSEIVYEIIKSEFSFKPNVSTPYDAVKASVKINWHQLRLTKSERMDG